jgi:3-methyladenine DNA glycosylase/8-oxoguanine DNA glycosylase
LQSARGLDVPGELHGELGFDPRAALEHLSSRDARLKVIIGRVGPLGIRPDRTQTAFEALARSIVYQQLTGKAAATILGRLRALFPDRRLRAEPLLAMDAESLRAAGLSRGKVLALRDLAARTLDGTVPRIALLRKMSDEAIIEQLIQVRGIGRWTAEMLLIFRLGRGDVLPVGDYGVRKGFQLAYGKRALPTPKQLARHAEIWRPYRTAASWYLWRAVDLAKQREVV